MKSKISFLIVVTISFCISACTSSNHSAESENNEALPTEVDRHNSQNSLEWSGNYSGIVPCADCAGIETKISLHEDQTYALKTHYLGENNNTYERQGNFEWNSEGNTITLGNLEDQPNHYFVGENSLTQLDMEGNKITGALAEKYVLKKSTKNEADSTETSITDIHWRLVEIMGKAVDSTPMNKEIYILLNEEAKSIQGNAGCNNIMGNYVMEEGNRIRFTEIVSTKMACPDMETETQLLNVLNEIDNYSIARNKLSLNRARMAPLARFEAVKN